MPAFQNHNGFPGVPNVVGCPGQFQGFGEIIPIFEERNYTISGVTKDSAGSPLGNCTVLLFNSATNVLEQIAISDASGNYSFTVDKTQRYFEVAYLPGAPDVAGTTVNSLSGA